MAPTVHPGKVTWMLGGWGGRMTLLHATNCHNYDEIVHGYLIASAAQDRAFIPGIASAWEVSADGMTWTVTVREGVKFHDGQPLTAEDVYFTWLQSWGPGSLEVATSGSPQAMAKNTEKIERIGPDKVSVTTKKVDAGFPGFISDNSGGCQGMVLPRHLFDLNKIHDEKNIQQYDSNPVAAGVMKLARHIPEEVMAFERFDDYYYQPKYGLPEDRRTKFRSLDLRKVPEEATRAAALRAGEADIAPISLATRAQVEAGGGRLAFGPEGSYIRVMLRGAWLPQYPISKKEVRQALAYALDLKVFQERLWGREVFVPKGWAHVTPSAIGYSPDLDPFPYNPQKARELLAAAGHPGGKGFGKLIINTWVSRAVPFMPESAQLAADFWKRELGIDAVVNIGDETQLKKDTNTEKLYGQMLWRENETRSDGGAVLRSHYGTPTQSSRGHDDPRLYKLTHEAMGVVDPVKRSKAMNELHKVLRDEVYEMAIGYVNIPWGVAPRVKEWTPFPLAFYPSGLHTIVLK
jgi:peptide/nickel transport system substrate-binding protein